jgi:hypothetical protein
MGDAFDVELRAYLRISLWIITRWRVGKSSTTSHIQIGHPTSPDSGFGGRRASFITFPVIATTRPGSIMEYYS